jgi:hypothetical protein
LRPAPLSFGVSQQRRLGSGRRTCADHARQLAAARLLKHFRQPRFGRALREEARSRSAARGPSRADPSFDLLSARDAVLRVPDIAARSLTTKHMPLARYGVESAIAYYSDDGSLLGTKLVPSCRLDTDRLRGKSLLCRRFGVPEEGLEPPTRGL